MRVILQADQRQKQNHKEENLLALHRESFPLEEGIGLMLHNQLPTGKYGVEIRIESVNKDNSHSWVRIPHGLNKLVTDLSNKEDDDNEQETSEMQFEDFALKTNVLAFASRSKAKAKPQGRNSASSSTRAIPIGERTWTVMEDYLEEMMEQLNSGESKTIFRNVSCIVHHWSDGMWKKSMARGGGNKKIYQYCNDSSGTIMYLRALQGHPGRSLIDPTSQDNVVIPSNLFQHIYHIGCAFNVHSIINSGLIPGGQNLSNRQTVFFLPVDPMNNEHKDPDLIDLEAPRLAQYMHKAWKNTVYWVDIDLAIQKGLKFCQTQSNAIILHETLPAYCISKVVRMETGEVKNEEVYASLRPPPKISLKHDWTKELGSEIARQPEGEVVQQSKQANQIQTQIMIER